MEQFEAVRHGDKDKAGNLSEEGVQQSKEKALVFVEEIKSAPPGSVFYVLPSNVGRATETGRTIESELEEILQNDPNVEFISVHDVSKIEAAKGDFSKKFIIKELYPTSSIGFKNDTDYVPAWIDYKKKLGNDEYNILMLWASRPEEMGKTREEMQTKFPDLDVSTLNPKDFIRTPETEALNYLFLSKRMAEITEKYFPGHPFKNIQVGHNPVDYAVLALMGKDITAENLRELQNGKSRDFLESSKFEERNGSIIVKYRDHEVEREIELKDIIKKLEEQSKERQESWKKNE
ncbi:MAG: hypothetical protein V4469_00250 [Patescibacteria group bacterium]